LAPPNAALLNDLGNARRAMGDKAAAVEAFSAAIKAEPGFAFAHFNLADALLEAGDVQRASAAYEDIIARGIAGIDGDFHVNRGLCRLRLGDAAGAMEAFRAEKLLIIHAPAWFFMHRVTLGRDVSELMVKGHWNRVVSDKCKWAIALGAKFCQILI
jgi:tetratricopeptide (TPR) repeat protein